MKYIVYQGGFCQLIIMFSAIENHIDIAEQMDIVPIRAGHVTMCDDGELICYGESVTLGIKGDPEKDTAMLIRFLSV